MTSRTVLLTGFEPFDRQASNASWEAVAALERSWVGPARLACVRLPVTFAGAGTALRAAIAAARPDVVVGVGEAGGRTRIGLERVAVNVVDARIPDNDGAQPVDAPVAAGAPAAYFSTLPVKACVQALTDAGLPAEVSNTAGTYVCNAAFFALMQALAGSPGVRGGFVHVPRHAEAADGATLSAADIARGLDVILRTTLRTGADGLLLDDLALPGGAED